MNEFYTVKTLLNAWRQLGMKTYPSDSKLPVLSASYFGSANCAWVYFAYLPDRGCFSVELTYRKEDCNFEKEYRTANIRRAMKTAYLYRKELEAL